MHLKISRLARKKKLNITLNKYISANISIKGLILSSPICNSTKKYHFAAYPGNDTIFNEKDQDICESDGIIILQDEMFQLNTEYDKDIDFAYEFIPGSTGSGIDGYNAIRSNEKHIIEAYTYKLLYDNATDNYLQSQILMQDISEEKLNNNFMQSLNKWQYVVFIIDHYNDDYTIFAYPAGDITTGKLDIECIQQHLLNYIKDNDFNKYYH